MKYIPCLMLCVSSYDENMKTTLIQNDCYFHQLAEEFPESINFCNEFAAATGIRIRPNNDGIWKVDCCKGADINFEDETPGKSFPNHNKYMHLKPNECKTVKFGFNNGRYVIVCAGVFPIPEEHVKRMNENPEGYWEDFTRMRPVINEYERLKNSNSPKLAEYKKQEAQIIDMYEKYYKRATVGNTTFDVRGFYPISKEMNDPDLEWSL